LKKLTHRPRVLSGIKISTIDDLANAITALHKAYSVPHVIVTSVQLSSLGSSTPPSTLTVIGSTTRSDGSPRLFRIDVPTLDCFFSGTGDMFAALTVARLREAVFSSSDPSLRNTRSWISPDDVAPTDLPLARSTEKVLSSMHYVLEKTLEARDAELAKPSDSIDVDGEDSMRTEEEKQKRDHLRATKAGEVRLVRNVHLLRNPEVIFKAQRWHQ
jgi:pyridoxine kinase